MLTVALLRIVSVLVLVAVNAFFVAAEFALVNVRDTRLDQLIEARRTGARTVRKLLQDFDLVLSGVQLGVTMAGLALGWIGESALSGMVERALGSMPYAAVYAHAVAVVVAFAAITYLVVILGEVVPKTVTLRRAEQVALAVAAPLDIFITICRPLLRLMASSSRRILNLFGMQPAREAGVHSPEEIKLVVSASRRVGLLPPLQEELVQRSLDLGDVEAREVMTPRHAIVSLPGDTSLMEAAHRVVETQHSRLPVYDPERGEEALIGVLHARDLMRWLQYSLLRSPVGGDRRGEISLKARDIMRELPVAAETMSLPDLLADFQRRKKHIALVVDEFGSTTGLITVEDILEQLVGRIEEDGGAGMRRGAALNLDGGVTLRDLELQFRLRLPRDEGYETLAGFLLTQLQRMPSVGDSVDFEGRRYIVRLMDGLRIASVRIETIAGGDPGEEAPKA